MPPPPSSLDLTRRADTRLAEGHREDAIGLYRASLALDPRQAAAWFNLGWALRTSRRFDEAVTAYDQAVAHGLDRPEEAWVNRAAILSDHLFRPDGAIENLERALAAKPGYLPALLGLGAIHEDRGNADGARRAYERAMAAAPGNGRAVARLGMVTSAAGDPAAAARLLSTRLDDAAGADDKADILFALGDAFDRLGRYDDAFPAFEAANWIARSLAPRRYDPRRQQDFTDRLIATTEKRQPDATPPSESSAPLFICGMFRSGSTLAERLLARHPDIAAAGELEFVPALAASLSPYPESVATLTDATLAGWREDYRRRLPVAPLVIDKRCDNFQHLGLIRRLFPESRIVHTRRDPLDNLLSVYFLRFGTEVTYGSDLLEVAHYYAQYRRLLNHFHDHVFDDIVDLDYDRLVSAPRPTLAAVVDALGLSWDAAMLAPDDRIGTVRTASTWQVRQPLHAHSSGRWRHYERHLAEPRRLLAAAGL